MKLDQLIKNISFIKAVGNTDVEISGLSIDSNAVKHGYLFICLKGKGFDGHNFAKQALSSGAAAVLCEEELPLNMPQIIVENSREAMSKIASNFYDNAHKRLKMVAVIGTNGKTTTAHLIKNILESAGINCGVIGTLGAYYHDDFIEPNLTTPDPIELHKTLFDMEKKGAKVVVMEVSAHAIYLDKVKGIKFHTAVFTNFSQDHLDFFGDMETYKKAKLKFFLDNEFERVVTNSDDELGREILNLVPSAVSYGINNPADNFAINICESKKGCSFVINLFDYIEKVSVKLFGGYNAYNVLGALSACTLLGLSPEQAVKGLSTNCGVSGRLEKIFDSDYSVFIDYAHTPDGLEKSLTALKRITENNLICVFGCGGNRDQTKRRQMGKISAKYANLTIITSDNPRYEEPMEIISEIEKGVLDGKGKFISIEDREDAISYALNEAKKGDVVLIAGKGAERYQEVLGIKKLYNDKDTVEQILRGKQN